MALRKPTTTKPKRLPTVRAVRGPSVWVRIAALGESIPLIERSRFPRDGARNLERYLHTITKR